MNKSKEIVKSALNDLGYKSAVITGQKDSKNCKFLVLKIRIESETKEVKISYKDLFLKSCSIV